MQLRRRRILGRLCLMAMAFATLPVCSLRAAYADEAAAAAAVTWDPAWRRFSWWDVVGTLAVGGGALAVALSDHQDRGHQGGVLLDETVREGLVARTRMGRDTARMIGDRLFQFSLIYPYLVDVVLVTWIGNDAPDVAGQMALINVQSQAVAALVGLSTAHFVGRARPSYADCERDPTYEHHCDAPDENASFMSGHTATVATTAGLICAHNSKLRLYGDSGFGLVECIGGIVAATGTGITRIVADRHWHSDVLSGATLGVLSGYTLPMVLHYGWNEKLSVVVTPEATREVTGVSISGSF